jgi:SPP1 family predicted phage head-tail adaptor
MLPRRLNGTAYTGTGSLNARVTLLKKSDARDANGEDVQSHEAVATVWAKVEPLVYKYTEKQERVVTESTHKITIRFVQGITADNLVQLADGTVMNIEAVNDPDQKRTELWLMCYARR